MFAEIFYAFRLKYWDFLIKMASHGADIGELDQFDTRILQELSVDGRLSITELASRIGLSKTPCQSRLRRLIDDGFIEGFRAILSSEKLGLDHVAFVEVKLSDTREDALKSFNDAARKIKEIEACHMIAGRFDYLLKVRTRDIRRYRIVLGEKISTLPFVASTSTNVVMQTVKENRQHLVTSPE